MLAGVAAEALCGFLPWLRTGERQRSAYELIDTARSLDALDSAPVRALAAAWYFVPLAAALCWLGVLLDRRRPVGPMTVAAALLAVVTGLLGTSFALLLERSAIPVRPGAHATLVAALAAVAGGTGTALGGARDMRKAGRDEWADEPGRRAATGDAARRATGTS